jgi:hypothetical protein
MRSRTGLQKWPLYLLSQIMSNRSSVAQQSNAADGRRGSAKSSDFFPPLIRNVGWKPLPDSSRCAVRSIDREFVRWAKGELAPLAEMANQRQGEGGAIRAMAEAWASQRRWLACRKNAVVRGGDSRSLPGDLTQQRDSSGDGCDSMGSAGGGR